jgi:hypothetical protein
MATQPDEVVLAEGPKGRVIGLALPTGTCLAREFLAGLGSREQARFAALLERLTLIGYLRAPEEMRRLEVSGDPAVYEIKAHTGPGFRLYVVHGHRQWVATHGSKKLKDKAVPGEVARGRAMYKEWAS